MITPMLTTLRSSFGGNWQMGLKSIELRVLHSVPAMGGGVFGFIRINGGDPGGPEILKAAVPRASHRARFPACTLLVPG